MVMENKVVWQEGMLLLPQHFQQSDRYVERLVRDNNAMINDNFWGFSELTVDKDLLSVGKIGLVNARGLMPDGTSFHAPYQDILPTPIELREGLKNTLVYLAIPLRQANRAEFQAEQLGQYHRYKSVEFDAVDMISNGSDMTPIQVASLNLVILTDYDDRDGFICLPFTRIIEMRSNGHILLDEGFEPSWLDIHQSRRLNNFIQEIYDLLNLRAEMISGRLTNSQQTGTAEVIDFMLLQLVNRYELIFMHLFNKQPLHPQELYYIAIQLLAEMSTYTTERRRPTIPAKYNHRDMETTFSTLIEETRHELTVILEQNATQIFLESRTPGLWIGQINDKQLLQEREFVLAVYADLPVENIRTSLANQIKIAPVEEIQILVSKALPGVPVTPLAVTPRQIPYHANFSYFSINTNDPLWVKLTQSSAIALHLSGNIPGVSIELWAIKG